jgi:hypothetical protein
LPGIIYISYLLVEKGKESFHVILTGVVRNVPDLFYQSSLQYSGTVNIFLQIRIHGSVILKHGSHGPGVERSVNYGSGSYLDIGVALAKIRYIKIYLFAEISLNL